MPGSLVIRNASEVHGMPGNAHLHIIVHAVIKPDLPADVLVVLPILYTVKIYRNFYLKQVSLVILVFGGLGVKECIAAVHHILPQGNIAAGGIQLYTQK